MTAVAALAKIGRMSGAGGDAGWAALGRLAVEMDRSGRDRDMPVRAVFALLGDRWTMLLLLALETGRWRHAMLRRIVGALSSEGAISQRMLTLKLRALERDGFVERRVTGDVPPKVDYALTGRGRALVSRARALLDWIGAESAAIGESRATFDAAE